MTRDDSRGHAGTDAVVDFVEGLKPGDVPGDVVERAVDAFTDTIGVLLGGTAERAPRFVWEYLTTCGQVPGTTPVLGSTERATPSGAALYHGTAAHALDYDDTGHPGNVHPSSHVVSALLSLAPFDETRGEEFVLAHLIGLEVENKIGACLPAAVRNPNIHPTGVVGPLAAVAAGSRLVGLDARQTRMALGIAASMGAGIRANNGTDTKPLHAGRAAESAVVAVRLAAAGATASDAILDARYGFMNAFGTAQDQAAPDLFPLDELGQTWELRKDFGIALKPYPCCACIHPGIEAALEVYAQVGGREIAAVDIETSAYAYSIVADANPDTFTRARFSMQYCVAAALVRGAVTLSSFTQAEIDDPEIRSLMGRSSLVVAEELRDELEHPARVTVTLADGQKLEAFVPFAAGKPARWLSKNALAAKFHDCSSAAISREQSEALFDWVQGLAGHASLGALPGLTIPAGQP